MTTARVTVGGQQRGGWPPAGVAEQILGVVAKRALAGCTGAPAVKREPDLRLGPTLLV